LNCRVMKAWENCKREERDRYMEKEEADRRRFMEEDEVASRHCFTLTARIRTDSKVKAEQFEKDSSPGKEENKESDNGSTAEEKNGETESPVVKTEEQENDRAEQENDRDEQDNKRSQDVAGSEDESPSKKNRVVEEI
jgi:hypothetical protein